MENDKLSQLWNSQENEITLDSPEQIINKAKKQRSSQFISIAVMTITVLVLLTYGGYYAFNNWNNFTLGMVLMISSLTFRIILEFISLYKKESQLMALDAQAFNKYLKGHYKMRLKINYIITPICFAIYVIGFILLLPYFKQMFSKGFYIYILISGFASMGVIAIIIIKSIIKERNFLNLLNTK